MFRYTRMVLCDVSVLGKAFSEVQSPFPGVSLTILCHPTFSHSPWLTQAPTVPQTCLPIVTSRGNMSPSLERRFLLFILPSRTRRHPLHAAVPSLPRCPLLDTSGMPGAAQPRCTDCVLQAFPGRRLSAGGAGAPARGMSKPVPRLSRNGPSAWPQTPRRLKTRQEWT